jgi:hypothetical protein
MPDVPQAHSGPSSTRGCRRARPSLGSVKAGLSPQESAMLRDKTQSASNLAAENTPMATDAELVEARFRESSQRSTPHPLVSLKNRSRRSNTKSSSPGERTCANLDRRAGTPISHPGPPARAVAPLRARPSAGDCCSWPVHAPRRRPQSACRTACRSPKANANPGRSQRASRDIFARSTAPGESGRQSASVNAWILVVCPPPESIA